MPKIHFNNGNEVKISEFEYRKLNKRIIAAGIKVFKMDDGTILFLVNQPIAYIDATDLDEKKRKDPSKIPPPPKPTAEAIKENSPVEATEEKTEKTEYDKFLERANCTHPEEYRKIFFTVAKDGGQRFFPVCTFCGKRERYVKKDSLSDETRANAKEYIEGY